MSEIKNYCDSYAKGEHWSTALIFERVSFFFSDPKVVFQQDGICKSFLEIMEGYMTTREKHLTDTYHNKPGYSTAAPMFDPKQFKANKEVNTNASSLLETLKETLVREGGGGPI